MSSYSGFDGTFKGHRSLDISTRNINCESIFRWFHNWGKSCQLLFCAIKICQVGDIITILIRWSSRFFSRFLKEITVILNDYMLYKGNISVNRSAHVLHSLLALMGIVCTHDPSWIQQYSCFFLISTLYIKVYFLILFGNVKCPIIFHYKSIHRE